MNSSKTKNNETKGKQKVLPKLKAILASPNKTICPVLDELDLNHLRTLLQNAIKESKLEARTFATQKGICLGMESSLRKINSKTSSCVFLSLSIKPSYIISLIARNAQTKNETQPVYAQPKLENFVHEIFGVRALCVVFPKDLLAISGGMNDWVEQRKIPARIKNVPTALEKTMKIKNNKRKIQEPDMTKNESREILGNVTKGHSGDFIAFDDTKYVNNNTKLNDIGAVDALSDLINNIPLSSKNVLEPVPQVEHMAIDSDKTPPTLAEEFSMVDEDSNSDDFLSAYKNLIVHKIKGNPNKNPKKKRKKNKKKN